MPPAASSTRLMNIRGCCAFSPSHLHPTKRPHPLPTPHTPPRCRAAPLTLLLLLLLLSAAGVAPSCDDTFIDDEGQDPTSIPVYMALRAEALFYGRVLRVFPERAAFSSSEGAGGWRSGGERPYTAELHVYCVLKGARTPPLVNITQAGYVPTNCWSTKLAVNSSYIVVAALDGEGRYRAANTEISTTRLQEVALACRLDPKYPFGVTVSTTMARCPTPASPRECQDERHFTARPSTTSARSTTTDDDDYSYESIDEEPTGDGGHRPNAVLPLRCSLLPLTSAVMTSLLSLLQSHRSAHS